jgi:hypothetical protein
VSSSTFYGQNFQHFVTRFGRRIAEQVIESIVDRDFGASQATLARRHINISSIRVHIKFANSNSWLHPRALNRQ